MCAGMNGALGGRKAIGTYLQRSGVQEMHHNIPHKKGEPLPL